MALAFLVNTSALWALEWLQGPWRLWVGKSTKGAGLLPHHPPTLSSTVCKQVLQEV